MACSLPAPLSMKFSRQEYWSGYPFSFLGDLPNPGIKYRTSAFQADSLPCEPQRSQHQVLDKTKLVTLFSDEVLENIT